MIFSVNTAVLMSMSLIFIRLTAIFFALPFFGDSPVTPRIRIFLSVSLTFMIHDYIQDTFTVPTDLSTLEYLFLIIKEIFIGVVSGFSARMFITGIVMAASIVGFQMGFGTESLMLPDAGRSMTAFSAFHRILVILIFFGLDMHHIFFEGIFLSFKYLPPNTATFTSGLAESLLQQSSNIFVVALKLSTPILVALMFAMAALGIIAKSVPQINIFTLSFPVSFTIGLLVYLSMMPLFPSWVKAQFDSFSQTYLAMTGLMMP